MPGTVVETRSISASELDRFRVTGELFADIGASFENDSNLFKPLADAENCPSSVDRLADSRGLLSILFAAATEAAVGIASLSEGLSAELLAEMIDNRRIEDESLGVRPTFDGIGVSIAVSIVSVLLTPKAFLLLVSASLSLESREIVEDAAGDGVALEFEFCVFSGSLLSDSVFKDVCEETIMSGVGTTDGRVTKMRGCSFPPPCTSTVDATRFLMRRRLFEDQLLLLFLLFRSGLFCRDSWEV